MRTRLHAGFATDACPVLREVMGDATADRDERAAAALVLGWWNLGRGDLDEARLYADHALTLQEGFTSDELVALHVDTHLERGDVSLAAHVLDEHEIAHSSSLLLRRANLTRAADSAAGDVLGGLNAVYEHHSDGLHRVVVADPSLPLSLANLSSDPPRSESCDRLVSVIMPVFNGAEWLDIALGSLRSQTWSRLEIIVVDDGSTDRTAEVAERHSTDDPRVTLIRTVNGGAYLARNAGLAHASGDVVTVHDADDWSHPEKIARQVRALQENDGTVASVSMMSRVDDGFRFVHSRPWPRLELMQRNLSSVLFRRDVIEEVGAWDPVSAGADSEFLARLRTRYGDDSVATVEPGAPLALCRLAPDSLSRSSSTPLASLLWPTGARFIHRRAYEHWMGGPDFAAFLPLERKGAKPFLVPDALRRGSSSAVSPDEVNRSSPITRFDEVVIADLHPSSVMLREVLADVAAHRAAGRTVGMVHLPAHGLDIASEVWEAIDGELVRLVCTGQIVATERVTRWCPAALVEGYEHMPDIRSGDIVDRWAALS